MDPNSAAWYELAQLPGIGEVVSRRIVKTRELLESSAASHEAAFRRSEDMRRVRGIGPKTIQRLRPFLRFGVPGPVR